MRAIFFLLSTLWTIQCYSQGDILLGRVTDAKDQPVIGATIQLEGSSRGCISDTRGNFELPGLKKTSYTIRVSSIGFETKNINVDASELKDTLQIRLLEDINSLDEVEIIGKSEATLVREQAYAVEVMESEAFKNLSTNANDILGRISGVNIRQAGGVGSDFSLSLNGLSGNQVRVFLDGVPMDYFGSSLSLNNFSANIIERIEVYKGVVPIHLSSDALGGAINVTTNGKKSSYLDASYSHGSFNTHLASINAQFRNKKNGFTARIKSFYNYSDNDYKVPVKLINLTTGKEDEEVTWVRRFHDSYESRMAWAEFGFSATPWADLFMVGLIYSDNFNEIQQPANAIGQAKIPYGKVSSEEEKIIANFTYNKKGLLNKRLSFNSYLVTIFSESLSQDTASVRHDWFGNVQEKIDKATGEIENRKTLLTLTNNNVLANANAEYALNHHNSLTVNYSLNRLSIQGSDPFKAENNTQFRHPSDVSKQVLAASYTGTFLGQNLKAIAFTKYYNYYIQSTETNYSGTEDLPFTNQKTNLGVGISASYQLKSWQIKGSYEKATRFPEAIELFGDGLNTVPSPSLLPEQSHNFNLGGLFRQERKRNSMLISVNAFLRDASDFIIPLVQGIKVSHINSLKVLSSGFDLGVNYSLRKKWVLNLSGTYLDLRDNNKWRNKQTGLANSLYRSRLPNVPYLFGNLSISYRNKHLFHKSDSYSISLGQNYVHDFYYRWEALASSNKGVVPRQFTSNLEMVYSFANDRFNASFAINNLWDAEVYDNFQQLRPGRNFNLKLRYFLNGK